MVLTERLTVSTGGKDEVVDLTEPVAERVARCGLRAGIVTVFVPGSTAGLTTMEFEPGAVADLQRWFAEMVPADRPYRHNLRWGDQNGHSHLRASLIGPSLTIPFRDGRLLLGTWQQIVLIDFDVRPRRREILLQIIGE
ncbi:MAG: secondary thiamine-phosphate synthase enzyme [Thermoflexus sp.]|uniref:secondary thiamine-phosphate synthase enzyme YjbQ n=1 Tax=Thermoflexus sp. TaxID=1969742 RepID=UPI00332977BC